MTAFSEETRTLLRSAYPQRPIILPHGLANFPMLGLEALVKLAASLPERSVEYNPGNLPIGIDPKDVPSPKLSVTDTIRSIEQNGSWMVLKQIEQHPCYAKLLSKTLTELEPLIRERTGGMLRQEGFIFISSPHAVTPFHFDPEHNILLQIRGSKVMTIFPASDETIVSAEAEELFHLGEHHRNQPYHEGCAAKGVAHALNPGDAVYVPVKAPHWVQNGPEVSISLSVTWRSEWSYAEADARAFNHVLRKTGLRPAAPAPYPARNISKSIAYRVLRRTGLA